MKRTKLSDRTLPHYSLKEERFNAISHGCGVILGIIVFIMCVQKSVLSGNNLAVIGSAIYSLSMVTLYLFSTLYHALTPSTGKQVFRIIDHCTIYLLIAGTYTPITLCCFFPDGSAAGWALLILQWGVSAVAITLNAIDLKKFRAFSYTAYIVLGWAILFFAKAAWKYIDHTGLLYIFLGGISYTVGAVLFAIGSKKAWFHSAFHVFVIIGSFLQFIGIYEYILP